MPSIARRVTSSPPTICPRGARRGIAGIRHSVLCLRLWQAIPLLHAPPERPPLRMAASRPPCCGLPANAAATRHHRLQGMMTTSGMKAPRHLRPDPAFRAEAKRRKSSRRETVATVDEGAHGALELQRPHGVGTTNWRNSRCSWTIESHGSGGDLFDVSPNMPAGLPNPATRSPQTTRFSALVGMLAIHRPSLSRRNWWAPAAPRRRPARSAQRGCGNSMLQPSPTTITGSVAHGRGRAAGRQK